MADPLFRQGAGEAGSCAGWAPLPRSPPAPLAVGLCLAAGTLLLYTASLSVYLNPPTHRGLVKAAGRQPPVPPSGIRRALPLTLWQPPSPYYLHSSPC